MDSITSTTGLYNRLYDNLTADFTTETSVQSLGDFIWKLYAKAADIFIVYGIAIWLAFGFFGNLTSIYIFFTKRKIDRVSSGYLGPLAIFDLWNVCTGVTYWMVLGTGQMENGFGLDAYGTTSYACWLIWYSVQFGMYMSGWIIVAFSCERCLAVWFPLKMTAILTPKKRRNIVLSLLFFSPLYAVVIITEPGYFFGDESWIKGCPPSTKVADIVLFLFWFICVGFGSAMPCLCILSLNFLILVGIKRAASQVDGRHDKNATEKEMRCVKNLLLVSLFYLIFMIPFSVFWSLLASSKVDLPYVTELAFYSLNWASQNYCINPLLYCYSLPWYRQTAIKIFTCGLVKYDADKKRTAMSKTRLATK